MDPVLDEMRRVKSPGDIRESKWFDWVDYLCALVAAKDDELQQLREALEGRPEQVPVLVKRGPGRPRKESVGV